MTIIKNYNMTLRQTAMKWWNEQSPEYKEMQWKQYEREYFTPSNSYATLTGREIERIYSQASVEAPKS